MVIYYDTPDVIRRKMPHCIRKGQHRFKHLTGFCKIEGDIPVGRINPVTHKFEPCVNNRSRAYGIRNALRYRTKPVTCW